MRLSDDKINHLSHVIMNNLLAWDQVDFLKDENDTRLCVKEGLVDALNIIEGMERKVRNMLLSYSRKIIEGSREWDVMYIKAFEEELQKVTPAKEQ
jgi:hypothetical protein